MQIIQGTTNTLHDLYWHTINRLNSIGSIAWLERDFQNQTKNFVSEILQQFSAMSWKDIWRSHIQKIHQSFSLTDKCPQTLWHIAKPPKNPMFRALLKVFSRTFRISATVSRGVLCWYWLPQPVRKAWSRQFRWQTSEKSVTCTNWAYMFFQNHYLMNVKRLRREKKHSGVWN